MIPYAGHDSSEEDHYPRGHLDQRYCPPVRDSYRALMMFRAGKDTAFIAEHFKRPEPVILRWIDEERSREIDLPNPYRSSV